AVSLSLSSSPSFPWPARRLPSGKGVSGHPWLDLEFLGPPAGLRRRRAGFPSRFLGSPVTGGPHEAPKVLGTRADPSAVCARKARRSGDAAQPGRSPAG